MKVLLLHGPNLNLLGERQESVYGSCSSQDIINRLNSEFPQIDLQYFQSNNEHELIDKVQAARNEFQGLLINPGAFSHTSIALADAIRSINIPSICIHISNIYQREDFRHSDFVGAACKGSIVGLGVDGYPMALECLIDLIKP
jgi:3-dehydroquinate dehydratase-2